MAVDWGKIFNYGGKALGALETYGQYKASKNISQNADPFARYRSMYGNKLATLMADPSAIENDPNFQWMRDQGLEAVERKMAAGGFNNSGNMAIELAKYATGFAGQYRDQELQRLAGFAGAGITPSSAASALPGYKDTYNQTGDLLKSIGYGWKDIATTAAGGAATTAAGGAAAGTAAAGTAAGGAAAGGAAGGAATTAAGGTAAAGGTTVAGSTTAAGGATTSGGGLSAIAPYAGLAAMGLAGGMIWANAAKKDPAEVQFNPQTGGLAFGKNTTTLMRNAGITEEQLSEALAPYLEKYASMEDTGNLGDQMKNWMEKPAGYDAWKKLAQSKIRTVGNTRKKIDAKLAQTATVDILVYDLLNQKHGLATGSNDVLRAIREAGGG